jgi:hypothetical protein
MLSTKTVVRGSFSIQTLLWPDNCSVLHSHWNWVPPGLSSVRTQSVGMGNRARAGHRPNMAPRMRAYICIVQMKYIALGSSLMFNLLAEATRVWHLLHCTERTLNCNCNGKYRVWLKATDKFSTGVPHTKIIRKKKVPINMCTDIFKL